LYFERLRYGPNGRKGRLAKLGKAIFYHSRLKGFSFSRGRRQG
jgi:hypothetical protein